MYSLFFTKKQWPKSFQTKDLIWLFIKGGLLGFLLGVILSVAAYLVLFLLSIIGVPVFELGVLASSRISFVSIFCIWSLFWFLSGSLLALHFLRVDAQLFKVAFRTSVVGFIVFVLAVIGVNVLRASYKYCPQQILCKRIVWHSVVVPPSQVVNEPTPAFQKVTITSVKDGDALVPLNGFVQISGTATPGQAVFLVAGFKDPEQFRFGKEQGTLSLEGVKAGSDGAYSIKIEDAMIPKGEVYIATFTSVDSDVPWASVYNAAIVKVNHKDVLLKKPTITSPSNGAVVKEYPVKIVGKALPHYGILIYQGYEVKDLQCLTLNTYNSGGGAKADVNGNFTAAIPEGYGANGKRNLRIAALPAELKLSGGDCFPIAALSDIVVFDYQGKIITQ